VTVRPIQAAEAQSLTENMRKFKQLTV